MSLSIGDALSDGLRWTASRNGVALLIAFGVFQVFNTVVGQSFTKIWLGEFGTTPPNAATGSSFPGGLAGALPFAVDLPLALVAGLFVVSALLAEGLRILGIRLFTADQTTSITAPGLREGILLATGNGVVGGLLASIAIGIGSVALVAPGVFVAVSLFFVRQEIALEGRNAIEALSESWSLTKGNRVEVFGLGAVLFVVGLVASSPTTVLYFLSPTVAIVLGVLIGTVVTVFGIAVATAAHQQLRGPAPAVR